MLKLSKVVKYCQIVEDCQKCQKKFKVVKNCWILSKSLKIIEQPTKKITIRLTWIHANQVWLSLSLSFKTISTINEWWKGNASHLVNGPRTIISWMKRCTSFRTAQVPQIKMFKSCIWHFHLKASGLPRYLRSKYWRHVSYERTLQFDPMCGCCFTWFHLYKVWTFNIAVTSPMSCHGMLQSTTIFNQWKLQFWQILFSWWDGKGMSLLFMHLRMLCSWRGLDLVAKVGTLLSELCSRCQVAFCSKIWKDQFYSINQHPW